jgi:hypothetical protein
VSIKVMTAVWDRSAHTGTDLLMLLALADFSDDQGNSYPSVPTLAMKCRMRVRNATYILRALESSGELEVRPNEGPKGTNRYRIALELLGKKAPQPVTGVQALAGVQSVAGVQSSAAPPAIQRQKPLQRIAPEPSLNRQEPSKKRATQSRAGDVAKKKPKPITLRQLMNEGVSEDVAAEFLALRKSHRAALTPLAWSGIKAQVSKAGWTIEEALRKCIDRGWRSFEAEWVNGQRSASATRSLVLHADDDLAEDAP